MNIQALSYYEEDGFDIDYKGKIFTVYGSCYCEYTRQFSKGKMCMKNGEPGYPDEEEIERNDDTFEYEIASILNEHGEEVTEEIDVTDFVVYMSDCLDDFAKHRYEWEE